MDTKPQQKRRHYTEAFRRQVVTETLGHSESVAAVALRHGLNANLVFKWRRRYAGAARERGALVPIRLAPPLAEAQSSVGGADPSEPGSHGRIEITLAGGHQLRLQGAVDAALVRVVLESLR